MADRLGSKDLFAPSEHRSPLLLGVCLAVLLFSDEVIAGCWLATNTEFLIKAARALADNVIAEKAETALLPSLLSGVIRVPETDEQSKVGRAYWRNDSLCQLLCRAQQVLSSEYGTKVFLSTLTSGACHFNFQVQVGKTI